jgi:hypothetical protein
MIRIVDLRGLPVNACRAARRRLCPYHTTAPQRRAGALLTAKGACHDRIMSRILRMSLPVGVLISLVLMAGVAAIHLAFGRPPICKCGFVQLLWLGPKGAPEESQHLFDLYSTSHVLHGLIFYFAIWLLTRGRLSLGLGLVIAVLIEGTWEVVENSQWLLRRYGMAGATEYAGDSTINSVADIVSMAAGFLIAAFVPVWASLALLVGTELWLLWLIRDNLTLNIINLIKPNEALIKWQAGGKGS